MDKEYEGDQTRIVAIAHPLIPVFPTKLNRREPWDYERASCVKFRIVTIASNLIIRTCCWDRRDNRGDNDGEFIEDVNIGELENNEPSR